MNLLDIALIVIAVVYGLTGFWHGSLAGFASLLGMLTGLVVGALVAPLLLFGAAPGEWASVIVVVVVVAFIAISQTLFTHAANLARDRVESAPLRLVDAAAGAVVCGVGNIAIVALLAGAVVNIPHAGVSDVISGSRIVAQVEKWKPGGTDMVAAQFVDLIDTTGFTTHADPFIPDIAPAAEAADKAVLKLPAVKRSSKSVFRIAGVNTCGSIVEGTSFLYAKNRLMTNAHVVSGVERPEVLMPWGPVEAKVVLLDPETDLAVLAVNSRDVTPLAFDTTGAQDDQAVAMGFPEFGAFHKSPIRVRSQQALRATDVHGEGTVIRDVFALRGDVRPGNSGGPLVSETGTVIGVVFANSLTGSETGYAMTAAQVADTAQAGVEATERVADAGDCIVA